MEDISPLPKINKIPFIAVDVLLIVAALLIRFSVETPLSPFHAFLISGCIALGGIVLCLPYLVEYRTMAKLQEYDLSQANTENARRIEAAMMGIQEIGESVVQQADRGVETAAAFSELLQRLESRIGEIHVPKSAVGIDPEQLNEALREQLAAVQQDFAQAIAEQAAMASDQQHDKLNAALSKLQGLPMQVTMLGDLAVRYQTLIATMSDTAASLITATPAPIEEPEDTFEDSVDGVIEPEIEENIAAEVVSTEPRDDYDEMDRRFEEEIAKEASAEPEAPAVDEEPPLADEAEPEAEDVSDAVEETNEIADEELDDLDLEGDELDNSEPQSIDAAEVEFLTPEDLGEDEAVAETEELESLEDDDDFDIALSSDLDEEPVAEAAVDAAEAAVVEDDESGMGFDDWDDFGDIPVDEEAVAVEGTPDEPAEETEAEPTEEPAQAELMADIPSMPKSKPQKAKGVTTLIAQVLIGIGNKPYVRGTGPGLSETEGVPMEFLEIGKWQWVAPESEEPVTVQIYKNDDTAAEGDPVEIPAGQRRSVAPKFPN